MKPTTLLYSVAFLTANQSVAFNVYPIDSLKNKLHFFKSKYSEVTYHLKEAICSKINSAKNHIHHLRNDHKEQITNSKSHLVRALPKQTLVEACEFTKKFSEATNEQKLKEVYDECGVFYNDLITQNQAKASAIQSEWSELLVQYTNALTRVGKAAPQEKKYSFKEQIKEFCHFLRSLF